MEQNDLNCLVYVLGTNLCRKVAHRLKKRALKYDSDGKMQVSKFLLLDMVVNYYDLS